MTRPANHAHSAESMPVYLLTLVSAFLSSQAPRTTIGMPRTKAPEVEKVLKLAGRSGNLAAAWDKLGRPGTWGNMLRHWKAAAADEVDGGGAAAGSSRRGAATPARGTAAGRAATMIFALPIELLLPPAGPRSDW
jgi:hypothetical protein